MELFFGDAEPLYILASNVQPDFEISQKSSLGPGSIRGPDLSFCLSGKISTKEIYQININKYDVSVSVYQDYQDPLSNMIEENRYHLISSDIH